MSSTKSKLPDLFEIEKKYTHMNKELNKEFYSLLKRKEVLSKNTENKEAIKQLEHELADITKKMQDNNIAREQETKEALAKSLSIDVTQLDYYTKYMGGKKTKQNDKEKQKTKKKD
jgi:hypothetical protein